MNTCSHLTFRQYQTLHLSSNLPQLLLEQRSAPIYLPNLRGKLTQTLTRKLTYNPDESSKQGRG